MATAHDVPEQLRSALRDPTSSSLGLALRGAAPPKSPPAWWATLGDRFERPTPGGTLDGDHLVDIDVPMAWLEARGSVRGVAILVGGVRREVEFGAPVLDLHDASRTPDGRLLVSTESTAFEIDVETAVAHAWYGEQDRVIYGTCGLASGRRAVLFDDALVLVERRGKEFVEVASIAMNSDTYAVDGDVVRAELDARVIAVRHETSLSLFADAGDALQPIGKFALPLDLRGQRDGELLCEWQGHLLAITNLPAILATVTHRAAPAPAGPHLFAIDWTSPAPTSEVQSRNGTTVTKLEAPVKHRGYTAWDRLRVVRGGEEHELRVAGCDLLGWHRIFPGGERLLVDDVDHRHLVEVDLANTVPVLDLPAGQTIRDIAIIDGDTAVILVTTEKAAQLIVVARSGPAWITTTTLKLATKSATAVAATSRFAVVLYEAKRRRGESPRSQIDVYALAKAKKPIARFDDPFTWVTRDGDRLLAGRWWEKQAAWEIRGLP